MPKRKGGHTGRQKTFKLDVHVQSEFCDFGPTHAVVVVTSELAAAVRRMRDDVKKHDAYCMETFDYTPEFMLVSADDEDLLVDWDGRMELVMLKVTKSSLYWHALIKHTEVALETETIEFSEIVNV